MGVAYGRAHKFEPTLTQVFAHGVGFDAGGPKTDFPSMLVDHRCASDEAPYILGEAAELLLDLQEPLGIVDCCCNFLFISDDARILQNGVDLPMAVSCNRHRVEPVEEGPIILSLSQHSVPA